MSASAAAAYGGAVVSFGTMHGKERQVRASFRSILGARVEAAPGIDTDRFGTFTGDVARSRGALETARAKALLGMDAMGVSFGLASEGSYGMASGLPVPGHQEILLFVDQVRGIEIIEGENTVHTLPGPQRVACVREIGAPLDRMDWSSQALTVRPSAGRAGAIAKGITTTASLETAIAVAVEESGDGHAIVEPDLRAHCNADRRAVLRRLGERLAARVATPCPACGVPGYGRTRHVTGLPCAICGLPTNEISADLHECVRCPASHPIHRGGAADPMWCDRCNP